MEFRKDKKALASYDRLWKSIKEITTDQINRRSIYKGFTEIKDNSTMIGVKEFKAMKKFKIFNELE